MSPTLTRRDMLSALVTTAGVALLRAPGRLDARTADDPPVLRQSDVVFMYESNAATYRDYGATVLAWGGSPTTTSLAEARGVTYFGSVGMVTEFGDYHDRNPATWQDGVCLDVDGRRIKVPWLVDMSHAGEPYWWCCTRQPVFRSFLEARVTETLARGAHGLHVDDHLGSAGALFLSACFCSRCVDGFREHLGSLDTATRERLGVEDPARVDYGDMLRRWRDASSAPRTLSDHPLWPEWRAYQLRSAADYMARLRSVAEHAAGRRVPMSANAGLLWPNHLADYEAVDFFSAEIDHQSESRQPGSRPIFAYRLADAVDRTLAATARGEDWALVLAEKRHRLVRSWAALGYASGHMLMAPHHQWCHTAEKGTHWYDGPRDVFAPLFRFVRDNAALLDGFRAHTDACLVMPHRAFAARPARWIAMGEALASANVPYRIVLGGDDVVRRPVISERFEGAGIVVNPAPDDLQPSDRDAVAAIARSRAVVASVGEAIRAATPAVACSAGEAWVLPRVAPGRAVVHVVNRAYEPQTDSVRPLPRVELTCNLQALGLRHATRARVVAFGAPPCDVPIRRGRIVFDVPGEWTMVSITE